MIQNVDVAVIGGGPAGLAAALECYRNGVKSIMIFERDKELGGILQQCIHNGFGLHLFGEELTGPEYAERYVSQIQDTEIVIKLDTMVLEITPEKRIYAVNSVDGIMEVQTKAVILAMGCRERTRGAVNIPGTRPSGIFTAGTAQRLVNMDGYMVGRRIVILGSGDIGLIMARRLTWEGAEVIRVCELLPYSSGLTRNIVQCLNDYQIPLQFNSTITKIHGRERIEGVTIANVDDERKPIPSTEKYIPCDTLLLSVGLIPENELTKDAGIEMDSVTGGAVVDENRQTSIEGIFACGNVLHVHDLVDNVSKEAAVAGKAAAVYVRSGSKNGEERIKVKAGKGVRYVVPHYITLKKDNNDIDLFFRVDNLYKSPGIEVRMGENILTRKKKKIVTPGEMETVKIRTNMLMKLQESSDYNKEITVGIIEV